MFLSLWLDFYFAINSPISHFSAIKAILFLYQVNHRQNFEFYKSFLASVNSILVVNPCSFYKLEYSYLCQPHSLYFEPDWLVSSSQRTTLTLERVYEYSRHHRSDARSMKNDLFINRLFMKPFYLWCCSWRGNRQNGCRNIRFVFFIHRNLMLLSLLCLFDTIRVLQKV